MSVLQGVVFITFDINTKETEFIRNDNITDYDTNATNIYVQSKYKKSDGETVYLSPSEIANYNFSLYTMKPLTNNVSEITGEVTNELIEQVRGGVIKFVIPKACTNRSGIVKCELHINKEKEKIASTRFILDVQQSLVTKFNDSLLDDEDFPVLKQLILEIQKASNINDSTASSVTTYSGNKIENIKEDLSSQIKDIENNKATKQELSVERSRIDNLSALKEGSTTGDAELIDARVGADNTVYENLGSANRTQFRNISEAIYETVACEIKQNQGIPAVSDLVLRVYPTWNSTEYIDCSKMSSIKYENMPTHSLIYSISFFDYNFVFISGITGVDNETKNGCIVVPKNAKYVRLVGKDNVDPVYYSSNIRNLVYENDLVSETYVKNCIKNTLHIGDSLTEGDYGSMPPGTPNVREQNYPYFLNQMYGWNTINKGICGVEVKKYWEVLFTEPSRDLCFENNYDVIYMMLGTNGGLTDTIDSDTVGNTYHDYANTNTGCYCAFIEYIMEKSPNSSLFICTIPYATPNMRNEEERNTTNNVIRKIAKKYDLKVIDVFNLIGINSTNTHIFQPIDGLHLGKLGYSKLAETIGNETINIFNNDLSYYKNV